ncbi:MAG TPA: hypothetical protein DIC53_02660 [Synergistaceae bacterium]|nr:hypothetical protein [Synergistaceae bacterium]
MRLIGVHEDDDGNGRYLLKRDGEGSRTTFLFYDEAGMVLRLVGRDEAEALFAGGELERCSLPAGEVFFPDEMKRLESAFEEGRL